MRFYARPRASNNQWVIMLTYDPLLSHLHADLQLIDGLNLEIMKVYVVLWVLAVFFPSKHLFLTISYTQTWCR